MSALNYNGAYYALSICNATNWAAGDLVICHYVSIAKLTCEEQYFLVGLKTTVQGSYIENDLARLSSYRISCGWQHSSSVSRRTDSAS